jgi:hypothetical protein
MNIQESYGKAQEKDVTMVQNMSFSDEMKNDSMKGIVTLIGRGFDADGNYLDGVVLHKNNLILNGAREIMRNVMFGDPGIYKIVFGDLGKDDNSTTSELINVPSPSESDTALVRKVGEKVITKDDFIKIGKGTDINPDGRPGIRYEIVLEKDELVPEDKDQQFILEMGLSTQDEKLFSRITHPVIIKTRSLQITLIWEILF